MINVPFDVKKALWKGIYRNEYRINVLNDDGTTDFTIDNTSLISESVNIDERMCSGDVLKFGLCEGSSLEFQYFNHPNLYGRRLQVFIDVGFMENVSWTIPMGFFEVKKCSRQADTGIMKVTAYNKLQSEYLDAKANSLLIESYDNPNLPVTVYDIRNTLLNDYEIQETEEAKVEILRSPYDVSNRRKLSGSSVNFISKWGIDTPLNYYIYAGAETSTSTAVYPFVAASGSSAVLDPTKAYHIKYLYDMEVLEQSYYDAIQWYMRESFDDFEFMDRFMIPQPGSGTYYDSFLGWHQFCGIALTFADNSVKWYSTIAYNNNLNDVVGTFKDLEHTTILNCIRIDFAIPLHLYFTSNANFSGYALSLDFNGTTNYRYWKNAELTLTEAGTFSWYDPNGNLTDFAWTITGWCELYEYTDMLDAEKIQLTPSDMPEFTLREITSASYETVCQYGQLDRETDLFKGVELNKGGLYPRDDLYPSNSLYPSGASLSGSKAMYSKLWADEGNIRKWRKLVISYKGLDDNNNAVDKIMELVVDPDGTDDYLMDDNWLFKNLVWNDEDVETYANAMVAKMQDITWFPFEMWCAGLPYLETGDMIEIPLEDKHYTSYVLQRQLKGIQDLQDTYINGTLDIF